MTKDIDIQNFSAKDALKLSEYQRSVAGDFLKQETVSLLTQIRSAADKGHMSITTGLLHDVVVNRLVALGYRVKWNPEVNQREPGWTEIFWG